MSCYIHSQKILLCRISVVPTAFAHVWAFRQSKSTQQYTYKQVCVHCCLLFGSKLIIGQHDIVDRKATGVLSIRFNTNAFGAACNRTGKIVRITCLGVEIRIYGTVIVQCTAVVKLHSGKGISCLNDCYEATLVANDRIFNAICIDQSCILFFQLFCYHLKINCHMNNIDIRFGEKGNILLLFHSMEVD